MGSAAEVLAHGGLAAHDLVPLVVIGGGALVVLAGYVRGGRAGRSGGERDEAPRE